MVRVVINETFAIKNLFTIYPKPANLNFTISYPTINNTATVSITDITGKLIYKTLTAIYKLLDKIEINVNDFSTKVYLVQIQTNYFVQTEKLLVKK